MSARYRYISELTGWDPVDPHQRMSLYTLRVPNRSVFSAGKRRIVGTATLLKAKGGNMDAEIEPGVLKVQIRPPCKKCGGTSAIVESYESDKPPEPGCLPLVDREITCCGCGAKVLYEGTYFLGADYGGGEGVMTVTPIENVFGKLEGGGKK